MTTRTRNLLVLLLILPPLLACLGPISGLPPARVNRMDEVLGEVQVIVGAERDPRGTIPAPNGRWLIVGFGSGPTLLLDLVMGTEQPIKAQCGIGAARWLDDHRFVAASDLAGDRDCYALGDAHDLSFVRLRVLPTYKEPDGLPQAEAIMRQAQELYLLEGPFLMSVHTVIALGGTSRAGSRPVGS